MTFVNNLNFIDISIDTYSHNRIFSRSVQSIIVGLILLSATVPNFHQFATWVGRIKQRKIFVTSTLKERFPLIRLFVRNVFIDG